MKPRSVMMSEQRLQLNMLCLEGIYDLTLTDGGNTYNEELENMVFNMIEVFSDEAVFGQVERFLPQTDVWADDGNFHTLARGTYFGYFRNIVVVTGTIRLVAW